MKQLLIAAALVVAGTSATLAQGYVYYGAPYVYSPGYPLYDYAPGYAGAYGVYTYAPGYYAPGHWYGEYDESGNSVRQPNPRSTIRAVR